MKAKLKFILPLALLIAGGAYKFVLAKPAPLPHHKVSGEVYVLPKDFLVNLNDGKFAKLGVALVLKEGYSAAPAAGGHEGGAPAPPEGYGVLPQEALVRAIVTDVVTNTVQKTLVTKKGRKKLTERIRERIGKETDVKVEDVLLTDVAVQ